MLSLLLLSPVAQAGPIDPTPVLGVFTSAEDPEAVQARMDRAIESVVGSMSWAMRSLARSRMQKAIRTCPGWSLVVADATLTIACPANERQVAIPLQTGQTTITRDSGEAIAVTVTDGPDRIVVAYAGPNGRTTQTFHRLGSGELEVVTETDSARVEVPLSFTARYRPTDTP